MIVELEIFYKNYSRKFRNCHAEIFKTLIDNHEELGIICIKAKKFGEPDSKKIIWSNISGFWDLNNEE